MADIDQDARGHGETISYVKAPERAPVKSADELAYWDEIDRIEQSCWQLAAERKDAGALEDSDALRAACMMLYAAFVEHKRLLKLTVAGLPRSERALADGEQLRGKR